MGAEKLQSQQLSNKRRENIILSSVLFDKQCRESSIQNVIDTNVFETKKIKKILNVFNGIIEAGLTPSLDMLIEQMYPKDEDEISRQKLRDELGKLKQACPPVKLFVFKEHLNFLKKHNSLKKLSLSLHKAQSLIEKDMESPSYDRKYEAYNFIKEEMNNLMENFTSEELKSINLSEGMRKEIDSIKARKENPETKDYVTTGYKELDKLLSGGYARGYFSLVSARPGMGKTVFMLNSAVESAKKGVKVLFVTIEMSVEQCLQRVLSKISEVRLSNIIQADTISDQTIKHLESKADEIENLYGNNLFIEEVTTITPDELGARIKFYKDQFGVELVFVDYLQIMRTNTKKIPQEESDFAAISAKLREVSKEYKVAIVLGAQLSRDVEKREDKRPMDSDLRNSGTFEQDAAAIIHLYRDAVYNENTEHKNILEVIFGKNRFGQPNTTNYFSYDYSKQTVYEGAVV